MKEVLYFSAEWCVPCKQMKPIIKELEADTGIQFTIIDSDTNYEMSAKHRIKSVPTFIYLEDGEEVSRAVGAQTGKELASALSL